MLDLSELDFEKGGGVVTVVTQDATTGEVLMVAFADRQALEATQATGLMHYRSRRRGLWRKGETSGNTQAVVSLAADCDGDAVLARVRPAGPACHEGTRACFPGAWGDALSVLDETLAERAAGPAVAASYTQRLLGDRNLRLKKLGEEAAELIAACADGDAARAAEEGADLLFHTLVALRSLGVGLGAVRQVLARRAEPGAAVQQGGSHKPID
jgi:phosphoribosyl-AMP cyclohydrolase / phosphoribosyl-ATP pyrophosphohydrolase